MGFESAKQKHLGNISRQIGHDIGNRYSYIVNQNDLINAYLQMRNELGYPLMVDSKNRRAIVYNKKGIEKQIQETINKCIIENMKELENEVAEDIVNNITNELNNLVQTSNGAIVRGRKTNNNQSALVDFANAMLKGTIKGMENVVEDIMDRDTKKRN